MTNSLLFTQSSSAVAATEPEGSMHGVTGANLTGVYSVTSTTLQKADSTATRLQMMSAYHMVRNVIAEFSSTAWREFQKEAKDFVKDQGESGHRP